MRFMGIVVQGGILDSSGELCMNRGISVSSSTEGLVCGSITGMYFRKKMLLRRVTQCEPIHVYNRLVILAYFDNNTHFIPFTWVGADLVF